MTTRRNLLMALGAVALTAPARSFAQQQGKAWRIGMHMSYTPATYNHLVEEFRNALKSLGHVEGRDIILDIRWAENRLERLPDLAADLLTLKPAVMVTHGSPGVIACMQATANVPIVFASAGDPVGQKFVQSFRRPGGNVTGVAFNDEINKKLYEVVREVLPAASRIATLVNIENPAQKHHLDDVPRMSRALHFQSIIVHATQENELEAAFKDAAKAKAHALVVPALAPFVGLRTRIVELQNKYRLPTFHGISDAVKAGAFASYSFPLEESYSRAAAIVDKILKGGNPAEIPVELPTKYEIALNLQAAKALGIVVPPAFFIRANTVIK